MVFFFFLTILILSCKNTKSSDDKQSFYSLYEVEYITKIKSNEIKESSGLANSPCQPEILWTHEDSEGDSFVFAISLQGDHIATFKVKDAENIDWEDIAIRKEGDRCFLYIGDIGIGKGSRKNFTIYKVEEPKIDGKTYSSKQSPIWINKIGVIKISHPGGSTRHDAETLLVNPQSGDLYILTKNMVGPSTVYKLRANKLSENSIKTLEKIAEIEMPSIPSGFLTGGSISFDGRSVVLCDYFGAYELILPKDAKNFDEVWLQTPKKIELPKRKQGEAVAYSVDGKALFATSEGTEPPLIKLKRIVK